MRNLTLLLFVVALVACGGSYREVRTSDGTAAFPPRVMVMDGKASRDQLRSAVSRGLADRGFAVNREDADGFAATLSGRHASIQVLVAYTPDQIGITYAGGSGLLLTEDGRSPLWEKQTRALEGSIRDALKTKPKPSVAEPKAPKPKRPPPFVAMFAHPLEWEDARRVVREGLAEHGWVVEDEGAFGTWIVRLDHGDERIRCELSLTVVSAELKYKDSIGLELDAAGRNETYERWLRNVVVAIEDASR